MELLTFFVPGVPAPQGSKTPWGSEANPRTRPWRAAVTDAAMSARELSTLEEVMLGPVAVHAIFTFPRPKSHYLTGKNAHLLREDAPSWHTGTPDLDKLQRAVGDALTGVVIRDDKQIAAWDVAKQYGDPAGVMLRVRRIS